MLFAKNWASSTKLIEGGFGFRRNASSPPVSAFAEPALQSRAGIAKAL